MQNGPADQADLADFIARGNKHDLVALLRHAGERLPSGSDTAARETPMPLIPGGGGDNS